MPRGTGSTNQYNALEGVAEQFFHGKQKADDFLASLGMIKPDYSTTITAYTRPAFQALGVLLQSIDSSVWYVQITGVGGGRALLPDNSNDSLTVINGNADGGPVRKGDVSWVGARGPELVLFGRDGYVVPNEALTGSRSIDPRVLSGVGAAGPRGYNGGSAGSLVHVRDRRRDIRVHVIAWVLVRPADLRAIPGTERRGAHVFSIVVTQCPVGRYALPSGCAAS